jgi:hypothetical protein
VLEVIVIGETLNPCCGLPVELEEDSGIFGIADSLVSSDDPGNTFLSSRDGLVEFWGMNVDVCGDEVVARLFGALFASEKPHCGQNVACLRISALHRGQRVSETDVTEGCGCCEGTDEEESGDG